MKIFYDPIKNIPSENMPSNRKIFVVHGRNDEKRKELNNFLKKIETEPIILEDQPIVGKTVLDQFEHYANSASFAIILMTADDFGGLYDISLLKIFSTSKEEEMKNNLTNQPYVEARARQNVITELGYFWGRLGLERLRILYEEGVTKPSDIDAAMYIKLDEKGLWKYKIARDLDLNGIKINMSLLDPYPE
jgi:predicted nucleotide-binding protein